MSRATKPNPRAFFKSVFGQPPAVVARAPGRIEFLGNHTDYNGGHVLGVAINRYVHAAIRQRRDRTVRFVSYPSHEPLAFDLDHLHQQTGAKRWANYPLGVLWSLRLEGLLVYYGFDVALMSTLPSGQGLSSSAALELAIAFGLNNLYRGSFDRTTLALLAKRAENRFVGVPSGLLDQGVSAMGKKDHLVHLDCRTNTFATIPLPPDTSFWTFHSHHKRALVTSKYAERHAECQRALQTLQAWYPDAQYLADLTPADVARYQHALPPNLYGRAAHVTGEQQRVATLVKKHTTQQPSDIGEALYASHASSRDLFENSTPELDLLVEALREAPHVLGARLTGGGFGGAVMAWTTSAFSSTDAQRIAQIYGNAFGTPPTFMQCQSGDGACVLADEVSK